MTTTNINKISKAIFETYPKIDWMRSFSMINTVTFSSYAIDEYSYVNENRNFLEQNEIDALQYSSALLAIAGAHYAILDVNRLEPDSEIVVRYSDWLLTTPLLLLVLCSYYKLSSDKMNNLLILNIIMIIFGFLHETTKNILYWQIGTIAYIGIITLLYNYLDDKDIFYRYFILGWSLYGVLVFIPLELRLTYFNMLDFYNKFIFAYQIRKKIMDDVNLRKHKKNII